ncbi:MAG: zinc-binding alcohol dehydrogenase family protein [Candidatus Eremiobacteraeota bacterium]|nr:zinc-binding alcohol dehydrogenase family protein [Candidatus Eremiobacteraeota bacterium]
MKALQIDRYATLDDLQVRDVDDPAPGKDDDVLVAIEAAGVNPSDVGIALGRFPSATLPRILGRDFAGRVVDGPTDLIGKNVWGSGGGELGLTRDGAHAQYIRLPRDAVAIRPADLSAEQAAAMGVPFVTAWSTLVDVAQLQPGEWAIISGANGAVGSAAAQIARALGANVIGLVRDEREAASVAQLGLDVVARTDRNDLADVVRTATNGKLANVALNVVGAPIFEQLLGALGIGGRMVVISAAAGREVTLDLFALYRAEQRLIGFDSAKFSLREVATILTKLDPLLESRALAPPTIAERFPLARAPEAYRRVAGGASGKVIITPPMSP